LFQLLGDFAPRISTGDLPLNTDGGLPPLPLPTSLTHAFWKILGSAHKHSKAGKSIDPSRGKDGTGGRVPPIFF